MTPELSRLVAPPTDRGGGHATVVTVRAEPAELPALAARLKLPAVASLACQFALRAEGGGLVGAHGTLTARVTQTCVVTLEDFPADVAETFEVVFVPEGAAGAADDDDPMAPDEIPYGAPGIDLGEAAVQQLALALDPWPHSPGAALPASARDDPDDEAADGAAAAGGEAKPNPFAALAALRRKS